MTEQSNTIFELTQTQTIQQSTILPDQSYIKVPTNAAFYTKSLRHSTASNIAVIEDIVDNSIDAGASIVLISTEWNKLQKKTKTNEEDEDGSPKKIIISDNGKGMNSCSLIEAFKLGSDSGKTDEDLGCFGIGLKKGGLSFCRRITVITRCDGGELLAAIYDLDHIIECNDFEIDLHKANFFEKSCFESEIEKMSTLAKDIDMPINSSGTVVIFDRIDNFRWRQESSFEKNLIGTRKAAQSRLSTPGIDEVFRTYLKNDLIRIFVNGIKVEPFDPIRDIELVCPLGEESIELPEGTIDFTIAELKTEGIDDSEQKGIGFFSRGFYVMRNDRQILQAADFGVFPNRNNINNLRIEMRFQKAMDSYFRTSDQKDKIEVNEFLGSKMGTLIAPYIKRVAANNDKKAQARRDEKELNTKVAEKKISQRSHLLKPIKGLKKEKRNSPDPDKKKINYKDPLDTKTRENIKKTQRISSGNEKVEFVTANLGSKGPIYEPEFTNNGKIKISLNREHQFYNCIHDSVEQSLQNSTLFLIYCLGREELNAREDHDNAYFEVINNLRWDVGKNMAILMQS